jgi:hypothetical protein
MTRARDLADYIATGVSDTELDILDGLTSTTAELNILDGVTSTTAELNILDGVTATTAELNYVDGVTSSIQTQMNNLAGSATIAVTVVNSGGNKYAIDGTVQQLTLLTPSVTYRFDQADSSNSGHPLRLSTTSDGSHGGGSAFTTGVTAVGTPGNAGAYTEVKLEQDAPDTLYYYCTSHSGMGGEVDVRATVSSLSDLSITSTATELNLLDGVTATTAELNILDGVTSTAAELNILDGVTSTAAELNILDGVTSTAAELNTLDGVTAVVGELNALDLGSTAVGNAIASKAVILDSNKDYTGLRNVTATGAITGGSFVIGSADINENDLESIDGITAGTIAASKAAVVDANKDVTGFRNVTLTGELDAATLDISGAIDVAGNSVLASVDVTGVATAATFEPDGDTAAGDNAAIGYTAAEGLILTGQGSTSDITLKNDADATVFTVPTGTDDILFPDNAKAMFGAGSDLQIYHDSNDSYVKDNGTGNLLLQGTNLNLQSTTAEDYIRCTADAQVELYHNNVKKLATESGGVNVTGYLDADNFKINGAQGSDGQVLTSTGSGVAFEDAAGGASALVASTVLGSAAATVTLTGFSTTYDTYRLIAGFRNVAFTNGEGDTVSNGAFQARFTADNGSAITTSSYEWGVDGRGEDSRAYMFDGNAGLNTSSFANIDSIAIDALITNPKNDLHPPSIKGLFLGRSTREMFSGGFRDDDLNVGGVEFSFGNGANFMAGSYFRIYGINKT